MNGKILWITATTTLIFSTLLLTGCWDRKEIIDLSIIKAAAIDKSEDDKIELTVEVLDPKAVAGAEKGGGGKSRSTISYTAKGATVADAVNKLQKKISRRIFWGQNDVFIFGQSLAKEGISGEIDYLVREGREHSYIFVSKGKAKDMLDIQPLIEMDESKVLRKLAETKDVMGVTMLEMWQAVKEPSLLGLALPLIDKLTRNGTQSSDNQIGIITGIAVLKQDKLIGHIENEYVRGIQWLRNEISKPIISVKTNHGNVSFRVIHAQSKLVPLINNGDWKITVKVESDNVVVQNETNLDLVKSEVIHELEQEIKNEIKKETSSALKEVQKKMKIDIFKFGEAFHRKYPKEWKKIKKNWGDLYPEIDVKVVVEARILRTGIISKPAGIPEDSEKEK